MDDFKSTLNRAEVNCTQNLRKSPRNGKYERKIKSLGEYNEKIKSTLNVVL